MQTTSTGCELTGMIYSLSDPRNPGVPKYIGQTKRTLKRRLSSHRHWVKTFPDHPLSSWFSSVLKDGFTPMISCLETVPISQLSKREIHWISFFRPLGLLTNKSHGPGLTGLKNIRSELNVQITTPKLQQSNIRRMKQVFGENGIVFKSVSQACLKLGVSRQGLDECIARHWRVKGVYWTKEQK